MTNPYGISERSYGLLREAFQKYPEVEEVLIFGSRAKGTYRKGSDIDLAIKGLRCSTQTAADLAGYLNEQVPIPYSVDVVYYDGLKQAELKAHIDRVGKPLFEYSRR
ncbi:nucleotidyltransferase domain-containing protein [Telluribacter sp.]|jgi:predicted nucleotidyltransferase|uniref:nucleotidyltransferase family protein n=1 Tax=Telluribacter sp. TaxID=1978767 RepID=UPI002E126363|nr:nucleotidyltransferase domain-containing protein [Telluribacter sp.]